MMKKILHTLVLASLLLVGCKSSRTDTPQPIVDANGTRIAVAISGIGGQTVDQGSNFAPATRAAGDPGNIMVDIADFASTKLALYGVVQNGDIQKWAKADRVIDTLEATVATDGMIVFTKPNEYKYFPSDGLLTLYSIYPSPEVADSPVSITDNSVDPVVATIKVGATFDEQYDILYGKKQNISVAQAQGVKMSYEHVMAQLRFKIAREVGVTGRLTKIVVRGVNKATMSILDKELTNSTDPLDSADYIAYDGAPIEISEVAASVGTDPLLLIPGKGSVSRIILIIDGQEYTSIIPETWVLAQGKINTATLQLSKFGVKINGQWEVQPWAKGEDHSGNLENNGKVIEVKTLMLDGSKNAYTAVSPTFADIEVDGGYTHKGIAVKSVTNGVLVTEKFNTGIIHDEPLTLTALKLYKGTTYNTSTVVFEGKLTNGVTARGVKVVIDTNNGGQLVVKSGTTVENFDINMIFGGFGMGTASNPYEVANAMLLKNIAKFPGSTSTSFISGTVSSGAYFCQVADIDLAGVAFTPIDINSCVYDGNGYVIRNLNIVSSSAPLGLFATVNSPSSAITTLKSIVIESGSITYTGSTQTDYGFGGIAGRVNNGTLITKCINKASVNAGPAHSCGGIVGMLAAPAKINGSVNEGSIAARMSAGGVVGQLGGGEVAFCYNIGRVTENKVGTSQNFGGVAGRFTGAVNSIIRNSYSIGVISSTETTYSGAFIGFYSSATLAAAFGNNFVLNGIHSAIIGTDKSSGGAATSRILVKTEAELKETAMVDALNVGRVGSDAMWKADVAPYINNGYPILTWQ